MKKIGCKTSIKRIMAWLKIKCLYLILGYAGARRRLELARLLKSCQDEGSPSYLFAMHVIKDYKNDRKRGKKKIIHFYISTFILLLFLCVLLTVAVSNLGIEPIYLSLIWLIVATAIIFKALKG